MADSPEPKKQRMPRSFLWDRYMTISVTSQVNKFLTNLTNLVYLKRILTAFIIFAILLIVKQPFEQFFSKYWVIPFISHFQESYLADLAVGIIVISLFLLWFVYNKKNKRYLDPDVIIFFLLISLYFAIYRYHFLDFKRWEFYHFKIFPSLKYVDTLIYFPVLLIAFKVTSENKKPLKRLKKYRLIDDVHIQSAKNDQLLRDPLAEYIANYVHCTTCDRAFAIGLIANWGDGKTSIQSMITKHLAEKDEDLIIIDFNPWKSSDTKKIVSDFFELYSKKISKYNLRLSLLIKSYSNNLLSIKDSWWLDFLNFILNPADNDNNAFDDINHSLSKINRKTVVMIDDLDRLNSEEILEVLKLIRNSANFTNTFFIVGYDLEYLESCIQPGAIENHKYLDKIFQLQFELSKIPAFIINKTLKEYLIDALPQSKVEIERIIDYEPSPNEAFQAVFLGQKNPSDFIPGVLKNLRDVKRFANYFSVCYRIVEGEVVFRDYFFVSLLKFKYPELIKALKHE